MITPKEKAKELFEKYYHLPANIDKYGAKQCALIAVYELINATYIDAKKYWQQVREEIEKL